MLARMTIEMIKQSEHTEREAVQSAKSPACRVTGWHPIRELRSPRFADEFRDFN